MLSSLAMFIKSLKENDPKIFDQTANPQSIKFALAILMDAIINAHGGVTGPEYKKVCGFFQQEFGMDDVETTNLFDDIQDDSLNYRSYLDHLKLTISKDQNAKTKVFEHLNHLITCDGCKDIEYAVFEKIKAELL